MARLCGGSNRLLSGGGWLRGGRGGRVSWGCNRHSALQLGHNSALCMHTTTQHSAFIQN